jgi:uncharacterized protein DUF6069
MSATPADRSAAPRWARRRRLLAVLAAVGAALTVWAIATQAAGLDLRSPAFSANGEPAHVGADLVAAASGLSGFAAWALLAALQRLTRRARPIWTACAAMALLVSLGAPLSGHGIDAGDRVALACLHLTVGAVLLGLLGRTARTSPLQQLSTPGTPAQPPPTGSARQHAPIS